MYFRQNMDQRTESKVKKKKKKKKKPGVEFNTKLAKLYIPIFTFLIVKKCMHWAGDKAHLIERLPSKPKALNSNSSTAKKSVHLT
jgi:hypothetical protein